MTHQPDEDAKRAARRESIRHLLDRAGRGVLIGGTEGELLRCQVEAEFRLFEADVQRWLAFIERGMDTHMQFQRILPDGTSEQLPCADWCHACRVEKAEAAIARVRRLCELTIASSVRVQAIDQARDTLTALDEPGPAAAEATEAAHQVDADTCRLVEVDGQTILMRGNGELTEQEQQFAAEILRAAKERYAEDDATTTGAVTCRIMETRTCPPSYYGPCGDRPCARFESDDPAPWTDGESPADRVDESARAKPSRFLSTTAIVPEWRENTDGSWTVTAAGIEVTVPASVDRARRMLLLFRLVTGPGAELDTAVTSALHGDA